MEALLSLDLAIFSIVGIAASIAATITATIIGCGDSDKVVRQKAAHQRRHAKKSGAASKKSRSRSASGKKFKPGVSSPEKVCSSSLKKVKSGVPSSKKICSFSSKKDKRDVTSSKKSSCPLSKSSKKSSCKSLSKKTLVPHSRYAPVSYSGKINYN